MGRGVTLLREHDVRIFRDAGKQSLVGGSYELDIELFLNRKQCLESLNTKDFLILSMCDVAGLAWNNPPGRCNTFLD